MELTEKTVWDQVVPIPLPALTEFCEKAETAGWTVRQVIMAGPMRASPLAGAQAMPGFLVMVSKTLPMAAEIPKLAIKLDGTRIT